MKKLLLLLFSALPANAATTDVLIAQRDSPTTFAYVTITGSSNTLKPLGFDGSGVLVAMTDMSITNLTATTGNIGSLVLEGATADAFETTIDVVDPTADRTATFPDADTKVLISAYHHTIAGPTGAKTITFPDASITVARTDAANTFTGVQTMTSPVINTKIQLPTAAGSSTLSTGGDLAVNTTDKQIGVHNGTKEVAISLVQHFRISFDPKAVCDGAVDRLFLMTVTEPKGITITRWNVSFEADPTTEADLDFKRADAFIGVANAAVMDVLDTTAGVSSEATAANINGGAVVATGKVLYLEFGTAYTETTHQVIFEFDYEVEED